MNYIIVLNTSNHLFSAGENGVIISWIVRKISQNLFSGVNYSPPCKRMVSRKSLNTLVAA